MGPIFPRDFGKAPNTFHPGRFLEVSVICGLFKGKTFEPLKISLVLLPNPLIDCPDFAKFFWPLSKHNLPVPMLIDAIKRLRILEGAHLERIVEGKIKNPNFRLFSNKRGKGLFSCDSYFFWSRSPTSARRRPKARQISAS